ncbi:hypothetical protein J437_LFUL014161 [Ladona fulva]|uniref:Reverse transcriptase domain-containing protein n=1 Tax=Ladona fulva TaxID=123851 RepID=A0A8K0KGB6_LADFU|nr:hypothetical protein J437_LFUL014161 [Ladona fulva]
MSNNNVIPEVGDKAQIIPLFPLLSRRSSLNPHASPFTPSYHLYADELQIYLDSSPSELPQSLRKINDDLQLINKWSKDSFTNLNPVKSQAIMIGCPKLLKYVNKDNLPALELNGTAIPFCKSMYTKM